MTLFTNPNANVAPETRVELDAHPDAGHRFREWRVISGAVMLSNPGDPMTGFTMGDEDVQIEAVFDPDEGNPFDGNAYFFWMNEDDTLSYHKFSNLQGGSATNYIEVSQLTDESGNDRNYQWGLGTANWALAADIEDDDGNVKPEVNAQYVFGNGIDDMGVQLDPCSDTEGGSSFLSNGDRIFRSIIYLADSYEAITFGITPEDYEYFPNFWDPTFFTSTIDISDTAIDHPAIYKTYLLNSSIKFVTGLHSRSAIKSIKALDVNSNAVDVEKNEQTGEFTITFHSNYYDRVVFEAEDENGEKYYFMPQRIVVNAMDNFGPDMTEAKINAAFFYPNTYRYNNFDVVATITRYDQKPTTHLLNALPLNEAEPGMEVLGLAEPGPDEYTSVGGKGLYASLYPVALGDDIRSGRDALEKVRDVAFTVVRKNALTGEFYGGTFSGSGKGTVYDIAEREIK